MKRTWQRVYNKSLDEMQGFIGEVCYLNETDTDLEISVRVEHLKERTGEPIYSVAHNGFNKL